MYSIFVCRFDELADTSNQMESTPLPNLCSDVDYLQSKGEGTEDSEQRNAENAEEAESATAAESSVQGLNAEEFENQNPKLRFSSTTRLAGLSGSRSRRYKSEVGKIGWIDSREMNCSPIPTKTVVEFIRKSPLDSPLLVPFFEADPLLMSSIIQTNHKVCALHPNSSKEFVQIASELICRKIEDNPSLIERYSSSHIPTCIVCIQICQHLPHDWSLCALHRNSRQNLQGQFSVQGIAMQCSMSKLQEISNVPVEPLHEYIRYCVNSCEQVGFCRMLLNERECRHWFADSSAPAAASQSHAPSRLALPHRSAQKRSHQTKCKQKIRHVPSFDELQTISSELNPFILKFSGHKDMTVLYQALAEAQSREAKNKKAWQVGMHNAIAGLGKALSLSLGFFCLNFSLWSVLLCSVLCDH